MSWAIPGGFQRNLMVCSLLPSWPQCSAVLRERMWLMRRGRRKGRYGHVPPLLSGWTEHHSQVRIQLVTTCCSLGTLLNPYLGGLCSCELHYCNGSQIVTALFIYCGNGAGDSSGFVITLCLMFLCFLLSLLFGANRRLIAVNQIVFELCSFSL